MRPKAIFRIRTTFLSPLRVASAGPRRVLPSVPWWLPQHSGTRETYVDRWSIGRLRD